MWECEIPGLAHLDRLFIYLFFEAFGGCSYILTVASVYSHQQFRGILSLPGSFLHLLFVDLRDGLCDWWNLTSHCDFDWHSCSNYGCWASCPVLEVLFCLAFGFLIDSFWKVLVQYPHHDISWGQLSLQNPRPCELRCLWELAISCGTEKVQKGSSIFACPHLVPGATRKASFHGCEISGLCLDKHKRAWVSVLLPLWHHTNPPSRLIPSRSTAPGASEAALSGKRLCC